MSKSKEDVASKQIFGYLVDQNRPYSVTDIVNNLHKEHGKTAVTRALEMLVSEKKVVEKTYGKQKIYYVDQKHFPEASEVDLKSMDAEINGINQELSAELQKIKASENLAGSLSNSLTTEEASKKLAAVNSEIQDLQTKLETLQSCKTLVDPEQRKALVKKREKIYKEYTKRKRLGCDILDAILENYPNSKKHLYEEVGIESDEGFKIPKLS